MKSGNQIIQLSDQLNWGIFNGLQPIRGNFILIIECLFPSIFETSTLNIISKFPWKPFTQNEDISVWIVSIYCYWYERLCRKKLPNHFDGVKYFQSNKDYLHAKKSSDLISVIHSRVDFVWQLLEIITIMINSLFTIEYFLFRYFSHCDWFLQIHSIHYRNWLIQIESRRLWKYENSNGFPIVKNWIVKESTLYKSVPQEDLQT